MEFAAKIVERLEAKGATVYLEGDTLCLNWSNVKMALEAEETIKLNRAGIVEYLRTSPRRYSEHAQP